MNEVTKLLEKATVVGVCDWSKLLTVGPADGNTSNDAAKWGPACELLQSLDAVWSEWSTTRKWQILACAAPSPLQRAALHPFINVLKEVQRTRPGQPLAASLAACAPQLLASAAKVFLQVSDSWDLTVAPL